MNYTPLGGVSTMTLGEAIRIIRNMLMRDKHLDSPDYAMFTQVQRIALLTLVERRKIKEALDEE